MGEDKQPPEGGDKITTHADHVLARARGELVALDRRAEEAAEEAVPANTRKAYELELACFVSWCARHGVAASPAEPRVVRAYLQELADKGRSPEDTRTGKVRGPFGYSALMRTLSAICRSRQESGHGSIWKDPLIKKERELLARTKGVAPKKRKSALSGVDRELFFRVCDEIGDDVRGLRDRAMLLVGWRGGGRRRSEIVDARIEHFEAIDNGFRWKIPHSKADQAGRGLVVTLVLEDDERYCAVRALRRWLEVSKIDHGFVFRGVDMNTGEISEHKLDPKTVSNRVKFYVKKLGLDPADFGGHSIRSGFVDTAYRLGKNVSDIKDMTGHSRVEEVFTYVRNSGRVEDSAGFGLVDEALKRSSRKKET